MRNAPVERGSAEHVDLVFCGNRHSAETERVDRRCEEPIRNWAQCVEPRIVNVVVGIGHQLKANLLERVG